MGESCFSGGRRAALSWSFDDARASQVDAGIPLLNELGVRATFYVSPEPMAKRRDAWRAAVAAGHEIGNHTYSHPCTANYPWTRGRELEDFTLQRMAGDMALADRIIEKELGVRTTTFAYPCGHTYVGRGLDTRSYVPLIAERFVVGRGFRGSACNDPERCDLAQAYAFAVDDLPFAELRKLVDQALELKAWVTFAGHDFGAGGHQVTRLDAIREAATYCRDRAEELWVGTVAEVGAAIKAGQRRAGK